VVLGKNPLRHEALFVVKIVRMSVPMRVGAGRCVSRCGHVIQLRDSL
jgi:hypothetical protein